MSDKTITLTQLNEVIQAAASHFAFDMLARSNFHFELVQILGQELLDEMEEMFFGEAENE